MKHTFLSVALVLSLCVSAHSQLVNVDWNTGNGNWNVATNWAPNDVPDNGGGLTYNVGIGNLPAAAGAAVTFVPEDGSGDTIETLTISGGADLLTNGSQLNVNGLTTITGAGSSIRLDAHSVPATPSIQTSDLDITGGGALQMNGGVISAFVDMDVTATGVLAGFGTLNVGDLDLVIEQAFQNSGLIQVSGSNTVPGTLMIRANGVDTIDLDGDTELGDVDVSNALADLEADTLTLIIDGPLTDGLGAAVGGLLEIGQRDTVTFNDNFEIDAGYSIAMNGGNNVATLNGPGAITDITGATFTITGDAVIENNMTFTGTANVIVVNANSSLTLAGNVSIADASAISIASSTAELIISGTTTINEVAGDFNWDGPGTATTTIQGTGQLSLTVNHVDTGDDTYGGTLNLNDNGDLSVNNVANAWTMVGTINKNGGGTSTISGDRILVTGNINANAGTLDLPAVTLTATADMTVAGIVSLGGGTEFAGPTTFGGTGTVRMEGNSTTSANTTINVATFDWDGASVGGTHTINDGVVLTINSAAIDTDGDMDDIVSLGGNGAQLVVNGPTQWTLTNVVNANTAAAGIATIGGTSRVIFTNTLNVDGNTNINAPVVFGASSTTSIDATMTLNLGTSAGYDGGTIGGLGTLLAASANSVTANSTINAANFDFDAGSWTISNNALLTVNVIDYDTSATNTFDNTITLQEGSISVSTGDPVFVMDGVLNMNPSLGQTALWSGEPVQIGNDDGALDADINAGGGGASFFDNLVNFNSDADVHVSSLLQFQSGATVNFNTVNGVDNAEFTGSGAIVFNGLVNVNEAVTFNMAGGSIDLDGVDNTGNFINIDAPMTINVEEFSNFGRVNGGGGVNTLDINNSVGTGVLTVNLDDANAEWTLNGPGVMNLVNDNTAATLLAGSDININGTVNVTGDVRTTARLDIAGVVNVNTLAEPLRLAGGNDLDAPNTLAGGTISGAGLLGADTGKALHGFGTIHSGIDFDGTASLQANGGTLIVNGSILDVGLLGTLDADGILQVTNAWNTNVALAVALNGGTLQGGTITNEVTNGIQGHGQVTARVINNSKLLAGGGPEGSALIFDTAGDDNDWDGAANAGQLAATLGGTLELRDSGAPFGFGGSVVVGSDSRVFANGFALDFNPGSTISLTQGTYEATSSTDLGGTLTVNAGSPAAIKVQNNFFLTFENGSTTTLNADLRLQNNNIIIEQGATFSGSGALVIPDGSHVVGEHLADIGVLVNMQGAFRPGNSEGIGRVDLFEYQQGNTGELFVELRGTALNAFDRLVASGDVVVDGFLSIDIDDIAPMTPFVPVLGNTFNIITGNTVTGQFDTVDVFGMPAGLAFHVNYLANAVQLEVVTKELFAADFDDDGDVDLTDYSIWQNAFGLNQLGDANGDNKSDASDYTIWRDQFGSVSGGAGAGSLFATGQIAVPEPSLCAILLGAAGVLTRLRGRIRR